MRILIVDDSIDKIMDLSSLIYSVFPDAIIETAENIVNASRLLKDHNYNLAVIDLFLPMRAGDPPKPDGGKFLLDEIYRKNEYNLPNYIIGFTQFNETATNLSSIWISIKYVPSENDWKDNFSKVLYHIANTNLIDVYTDKLNKKTPYLFVEGLTDKFYLEQAIDVFFKEKKNIFKIISQKNAGANWVANQIPIWAMKLQKDEKGNYIKSIGLFDSDQAGILAKEKIAHRNLSDNEKQCFSIIQLKASYNDEVLNFYKKGVKIEIEIESLFSEEILNYADRQNWLENRIPVCLTHPKSWNSLNENFEQFLKKIGIEERKFIYLKKVKKNSKEKFLKYIESLSNKEKVYSNFRNLLNDVFN